MMPRESQNVSGVYLLCFSNRIGNERHSAKHYIGWAKSSIKQRVAQHRAGSSRSASITRAAVAQGITLKITRIWANETRDFERALKNKHNAKFLCPICKEKALSERRKTSKARRLALK